MAQPLGRQHKTAALRVTLRQGDNLAHQHHILSLQFNGQAIGESLLGHHGGPQESSKQCRQ